jgi:hypothetical protein
MYPTVIFVLVGIRRSFRDQVFTDAVLDGVGAHTGAGSSGGSSVGNSVYDIVELTIPTVDAESTIDGTGSVTADVSGKDTGACERPVACAV